MPINLSNLRLARYATPSVTAYSRLEASPRDNNFDRSLRAEVRDPLWMLTRQWQLGEFLATDGGSPYTANVHSIRRTPVALNLPAPFTGELNGGATMAFGQEPLEVCVEREALSPDLWLRVQIGRHFAKLMRQNQVDQRLPLLLSWYPLAAFSETAEDDPEGYTLWLSVNGKVMDGWKLLQEIQSSGQTFQVTIDRESTLTPTDRNALKNSADQLVAWYERLYSQPAANQSTWSPAHLSYRFSLSFPESATSASLRLEANRYAGGTLDWYAMDEVLTPKTTGLAQSGPPVGQQHTEAFIPNPAQYAGMPKPRFWEMEDGAVNYGRIAAGPTGLFSMLLADYGLLYSNDWFVVPYPLPANTLCEVAGILVTDVFGRHHWIRPALNNPESNWQQQAFFHHTETRNRNVRQSRFYLTPTLAHRLQGPALERVQLMRDEMANLVWGIEQVLPSQAGNGRAVNSELPAAPPPPAQNQLTYQLGQQMPKHWIPFMPVKLNQAGNSFEIALQRAKLPNLPGPEGRILSAQTHATRAIYLLNEEEARREGVLIERAFQRTRWYNGRTYLWVGRQRTAGSGEGESGLRFDTVWDK